MARAGRTRRGQLQLDPQWLLTEPLLQTYSAGDLGAWLLLLNAAWLSDDLSIPGDPASLAALSRLGAAWEGSRIAQTLSNWFEVLPGGRLACRFLAGQRDALEAIVEKRRRAGRASAQARASNTRSTCVEHVLNTCPTGDTAAGAGRRAKPCPNVHSGQVAAVPVPPPGGGDQTPARGKPHCIDTPANPEVSEVCAQTGGVREGGPLVGAGSAPFGSPPYPPYREDSNSGGDRGGVGGTGGVQMTLFGEDPAAGEKASSKPVPPIGKRQPTAKQLEAASDVCDHYQTTVGTSHRRSPRADKNAAYWLANGFSVEDLRRSIDNYTAYCDAAQRDADYRKSAANFFARRDPVFRNFLKEQAHGPSQNHRLAGGARIRTGDPAYDEAARAKTYRPPADAAEREARNLQGENPAGNPFLAAAGHRGGGGGQP